LQGTAVGHPVAMPFLRDFAVHARFILAVPLLIFAEVILGPHLGHASVHFIHSVWFWRRISSVLIVQWNKGLGGAIPQLQNFCLLYWHTS
jgi:hypothetical protein